MKFDDLRARSFKEAERSVCGMLMMGMIFSRSEKPPIYSPESSFDLTPSKPRSAMSSRRIFNKASGQK
jgi:hypothetical protein